jgi:hypothetical protein
MRQSAQRRGTCALVQWRDRLSRQIRRGIFFYTDLGQWAGFDILWERMSIDGSDALSYRVAVGVSLTQKELPDDPDDIKRFPFQSSFNSFYNRQIAKGRSEMSASEFSDFKHQFMAACTVKQKGY